MFTIQCDIHYVDGTTWHGTLASWAEAPSEGVDYVDVGGKSAYFSGDSIYYCQVQNVALDGDEPEFAYVLGSYAPYQKTSYSEAVFTRKQAMSRKTFFPPDLKISEVKLGWWRVDDG